MRVLVAEDDPISYRVLERTLVLAGFGVVAVRDGAEAWRILQTKGAPELAILDWMMPLMDGPEVCRRVRETSTRNPTYIILVTARGRREDIVAGLDAGANDYVVKPFDQAELRARVRVGARVVELQKNLSDHIRHLEDALSQVKQLQGLLPICSYCKKIRDDQDYWHHVEAYLGEHSEVQFSHGFCPDCYEKFLKPELEISKPGGENSE
ncbi:MAG: response regulator transcription factor [Terriglobia bacterium]